MFPVWSPSRRVEMEDGAVWVRPPPSPPSEAPSDVPTETAKKRGSVRLQGLIDDKQRMIDYLLAEVDELQKRETNLMEKNQLMRDSNVHLRTDNAELRHENERLKDILRGERISAGMAQRHIGKLNMKLKAAEKERKLKMVGSRMEVFKGKALSTSKRSKLQKGALIKNQKGKIVSAAQSQATKSRFAESAAGKWAEGLRIARAELGETGFCPLGGKSARGQALLAKTKEAYARLS